MGQKTGPEYLSLKNLKKQTIVNSVTFHLSVTGMKNKTRSHQGIFQRNCSIPAGLFSSDAA